MDNKERLYQSKVNQEFGRLVSGLEEERNRIILKHEKRGTIGALRKELLDFQIKNFDSSLSIIYKNCKNILLDGVIDSEEKKGIIEKKLHSRLSVEIKNHKESIKSKRSWSTQEKNDMIEKLERRMNSLIQQYKTNIEIEFLNSKKSPKQDNQIGEIKFEYEEDFTNDLIINEENKLVDTEMELLKAALDDNIGIARLEPIGTNTFLTVGNQKYYEGKKYSSAFTNLIDLGLIKHEEKQLYRITREGRQVAQDLFCEPRKKNRKQKSQKKRFKIALTFPGEKRDFVEKVAQLLCEKFGRDDVFYDKNFKAELARPNLDTYLQNIYHNESELIVIFLCSEYKNSEWCGLEWRAIRDLIKKRESSDIMPIRFDDTQINGLFSIDGYIDISNQIPRNVTELIIERYQSNKNLSNSEITFPK